MQAHEVLHEECRRLPLTMLLALLRQAGSRSVALAKALVAGGGAACLEALCTAAPWAPQPQAWQVAERQAAAVHYLGLQVVPVWDLPPALRRVEPCPPALFVRGDVTLLAAPAVAIVGSRAAGQATAAWACAAAQQAAQSGWVVVSGGALGIDAAAHRGALQVEGGRTLVYLGVAADRVYPAQHKELFARIVQRGGALVSEHPPGAVTYAAAHALRNRFIAAQAQHVVLVEAAEDSGSLGTARWARRLGVPLFVAPAVVGGERGGIEALVHKGWATVGLPWGKRAWGDGA